MSDETKNSTVVFSQNAVTNRNELEKRIAEIDRSNRRDRFIAAALTGLAANPGIDPGSETRQGSDSIALALTAIQLADAVMAELES